MAKKKKKQADNTLPSLNKDTAKAGSGYVLIEKLDIAVTVTKGGIHIPEEENLNTQKLAFGRVLHAGRYVTTGKTGRIGSGSVIEEEGWLERGRVIQYIPHNPWETRGNTVSPAVLVIKCEDVCVL